MKLLYITSGLFPRGSAYASRLLNFARLIKDIGFDIHIMVDYVSDKKFLDNNNYGLYEDISFQVIGDKISSLKSRIMNPRICRDYLKEYLDQNKVDLIIMSSSSDRFNLLFQEIKKRQIPIILESCEWFHYSNWRGGKINPFYRQYENCFKNHFIKVDGVIAISRLLEEHYRKHVGNVIRIPTILDVSNIPFNLETKNEKITLMYAGNPGKSKELISNILIAFHELGEEKERFIFNIFGIGKEQLEKQLENESYLIDDLKGYVNIKGKVLQDLINEEYQKSDFGIFLRPNRRSSHAGFPTKLAESMAAGTPVICNDTGDISLYVNNGINGFLLKDESPTTLKEALREINRLSKEQLNSMRSKTRITAEQKFDYRDYKEDVKEFILLIEKTLKNK
ncbi:MAG: glycosyltransferase family 4 protein [Tissierellaceae bacterium]|nr:glycosyltransferase family 4 protein [Tissierellaceae bacterium]